MSKIYTSTGDKGTTALVGGKRVRKDCTRVEAYGTVDELNAQIGVVTAQTTDDNRQFLVKIQNRLFNIGAHLATENEEGAPVYGLSEKHVHDIEEKIDELSAQLPPFQGFILPGGSALSTQCDVCRTVCRRAERRIVTLAAEAPVNPLILQYLNRLSDFLFIFARFNNITQQKPEMYWDKTL